MTENERLTIDEIIEHCNRRVERFESFSSRDMCENWSLDSQYGKEYWGHRQVANYLEELLQYRAIGTIEEFKNLKEKAESKKPIRKLDINGKYEEVTCPNCGRFVDDYTNKKYCNCGQALDWQ